MSTMLDASAFQCANCDAAIPGRATFFVGLAFCCPGCVAGGPCTCSYDPEPPASAATERAEEGCAAGLATPRDEAGMVSVVVTARRELVPLRQGGASPSGPRRPSAPLTTRSL